VRNPPPGFTVFSAVEVVDDQFGRQFTGKLAPAVLGLATTLKMPCVFGGSVAFYQPSSPGIGVYVNGYGHGQTSFPVGDNIAVPVFIIRQTEDGCKGGVKFSS
jgi:hypothetical protein